MKRNNGKKKPGCYAYTIGNGEENATSIDVKKSIWTAWAERLNKEDNWFRLIYLGVAIFVVASIIGLFLNHWVGFTIRVKMSIFYIILMVIAVFVWGSETEKRGRISWKSEGAYYETRLFWLAITKSIAQFCVYMGICLLIPCLIMSNWSGRGYTDDKGRTHVYDAAYYYQSGQEFTRPYPTFWAWPWVKIAVLPPLKDNSIGINVGERKVVVDYKAEYDEAASTGVFEEPYSKNTAEANSRLINQQIILLVQRTIKTKGLPREVFWLRKPLNTALATDASMKVKKLQDLIADGIKKKGLIPGIKITSLEFPT